MGALLRGHIQCLQSRAGAILLVYLLLYAARTSLAVNGDMIHPHRISEDTEQPLLPDSPTTTTREQWFRVRRAAKEEAVGRRGLIGSSPPRCKSKCERCSPCTAVHVAIKPGLSLPLEYYPEAWRCKCGNNLYMP